MNPVIIVAMIVQMQVSKKAPMAGAILGYVTTTGILVWGLSLYAEDSQITFFGVPLSAPVFMVLSLVWYGFDTKAFLKARKVGQSLSENKRVLSNAVVRSVWSATWRAWMTGQGTPVQEKEARGLSEEAFVDGYIRKSGGLIECVTNQRPFEPGEFIVYATLNPAHDVSVLTDRTLYLFSKESPRPNPARIIPLSQIEDYRFDTGGRGRVTIKLRSGEAIEQQRNAAPKEDFVNRYRGAAPTGVTEQRRL
jgi:hypothetical protein